MYKIFEMGANKKHILNELNNLLRLRFSDEIKDVILFGSRAFGKSKKDSDYDILIIFKNKVDWKQEREISDLCYEIDLKFNILTDTHVLCEADLFTLRGRQPVFLNALEKGYHA